MKFNEKVRGILLLLMVVIIPGEVNALVDELGRESTDYIMDYRTGEITYFQSETYDDIDNTRKTMLTAECNYVNDETGATVEWIIPNGIFTNAISNYGLWTKVFNGYKCKVGYHWMAKTGMHSAELWPTGKYINDDDEDGYVIPASHDWFIPHDGCVETDFKVTVLELESISIGTCPLLRWGDSHYAAPRKPKTVSSELEYVPSESCKLHIHSYNPGFSLYVYFGFYNKETWDLKAVTRIKYHVSNASYSPIKPVFGSVQGIHFGADDQDKSSEMIYDLMGRRVEASQMTPGSVYIRNGCKFVCR